MKEAAAALAVLVAFACRAFASVEAEAPSPLALATAAASSPPLLPLFPALPAAFRPLSKYGLRWSRNMASS